MNARAIVAPFVVRGEAEGAERSIFPQLMISGEPTETTIVRGEAEGAEGSIFPHLTISGELREATIIRGEAEGAASPDLRG
jgi:type IV secretory pathway ATPase VirB11/archaellum biosynthesis ATPase